MIQQPPGSGDQDIHTTPKLLDLRVDLDPAEDHRRTQIEMPAIGGHTLAHLGGQFAGRGEDEGTHRAASLVPRLRQAMQQWQGETGRLAGARLRPGKNVSSLEDDGNGLGLNGSRRAVALFGDGAQDVGREAELFEGHDVMSMLVPAGMPDTVRGETFQNESGNTAKVA